MTFGCIVQARTGSTRLPQKVLKKIDKNTTILSSVINQLQHSNSIEKIVIATTDLEEDDVIEEFARAINVDCFRGNEFDVLDRYYKCALNFSFKTIIRITSDNPLIDPTILDQISSRYLLQNYDYMSNNHPRTFPIGTEVEIFSFNALEQAWINAQLASEREHVTPYFYNNPEQFKIGNFSNSEDFSFLCWSVDRENDLELVKQIMSSIKKRPILLLDILELYKKSPKIFDVNKNHKRDEGYQLSLNQDHIFKQK
jgi:spore coat polysaccharide biosynthesis protein SpsF